MRSRPYSSVVINVEAEAIFFFNGKNAEKICAKYKCQNTYLVTPNNHIFDLQKTTKIDKYTAAYVFKSILGKFLVV